MPSGDASLELKVVFDVDFCLGDHIGDFQAWFKIGTTNIQIKQPLLNHIMDSLRDEIAEILEEERKEAEIERACFF